jgi:signal transduction histidine kinase
MTVPRRLASLRARILGVVIVGAVLPLGCIGWWLSRAAAVSAEQRLQTQVDSTLQRVTASMEERWRYREADLQLITQNDVVQRLLAGRGGAPSASDSAYLASLESMSRTTVSRVTYRDQSGAARWAFGGRDLAGEGSGRPRQPEPFSEPALQMVIPVRGAGDAKLGAAEVMVRLTALLPADSAPNVIVGSSLRIRDAATRQLLSGGTATDGAAEARWVSATRTLTAPPLEVELAAPASAYLEPFQRAAKLGGLTLLGVALLAIVLSAFLASRVTRSLEQLVEATDAVAKGELDRTVGHAGGADEVGRLAKAFNAMTDSLRATLDKLSQRESLAAVGEFAASLSHEVRNALTSVRLDLQRAQEKLPPDTASRDLVLRALQNVKRLDVIVAGALRVARSGQTPLQPVELQPVVRSAMSVVEPAFSGHALTLSDEVGHPAWVRGDAIAIEQLLVNLLFNALQSLGENGRVVVSMSAAGGKCEVAVADNGRGIKPRDLARLGEPFYTSRAGGTGLGLSIARRIATAHGGDLVVESTVGEGTRARVVMDAIAAPVLAVDSTALTTAAAANAALTTPR